VFQFERAGRPQTGTDRCDVDWLSDGIADRTATQPQSL
jgi:hypothetical protein